MAAAIVNANDDNNVTNIKINVVDMLDLTFNWALICNQYGEATGDHPKKEAACSDLGRLQVPLDEAIETAQPTVPCLRIYRSVKLSVNGIVNSEEAEVVHEFGNLCMAKGILTAAGVPNLIPVSEDGLSYDVGDN
ncbi:hypothetical protein INT45_001094 [Circinella minor]|uniref:Subtilisin inhibitor domain-containing protein n=1 Tax=Circinella minor TaxID=1195481 RepID=A0A8H7VPP3_9FUNG|nr:hypothetical protein INT45_001094 [Circinella minor]